MKKLLLVISDLQCGGAQKVFLQLAHHWQSKGHPISIVTLEKKDTKPFYPINTSIPLIQIDQLNEGKNFFQKIKNLINRTKCLRTVFIENQPDRIISFVDLTNIQTLLSALGLGIPIISCERTHPRFHPLPFFYKFLRSLLYRKSEKIIVQTQGSAEYFKKIFHKVMIIPNIIQTSSHEKKVYQGSARHLISSGRLLKTKNFHHLILAFSKVSIIHPSLQLTIYGEGPERGNLTKLIQALGLEKKISLPGALKNLSEKLAQADLYVFPSLYEGFPNALAEAMSIGLPILASNCSGNTDLIQDQVNGRLFPVGDLEKMTSILKELVEDSPQRERLGQNAKTITQTFSAEKILPLWDLVIR